MINVEELRLKAIEGMKKAYSPYSKFSVGAALLLKNGKYFIGCNIENASFPLCNCAERTAMFKMISEGYTKADVVAMAVVGDTENPISPCGACRQVMSELLNKDTPIYLTNLKGDIKEVKVSELLPYSFDELK